MWKCCKCVNWKFDFSHNVLIKRNGFYLNLQASHFLIFTFSHYLSQSMHAFPLFVKPNPPFNRLALGNGEGMPHLWYRLNLIPVPICVSAYQNQLK